jgi:hypothetical protein
MCPVCLATTALVIGTTAGSGGLTALAATFFLRSKGSAEFPTIKLKEDRHDDIDSGTNQSESGLPR